ncbi:MAG: hypothetical protein ACR2KL_01400 [Nocardioidaceae bacterium]
MSDRFVNLNEGIGGVARVAQQHADGGDAHNAQSRRMQASTEGLNGRLVGPSGRGVQNVGVSRANTSVGMSKQSSDIADRSAGFGIEHARATEEAATTANNTHKATAAVESNVLTTRLNAG